MIIFSFACAEHNTHAPQVTRLTSLVTFNIQFVQETSSHARATRVYEKKLTTSEE
jgi:hypothetical protein